MQATEPARIRIDTIPRQGGGLHATATAGATIVASGNFADVGELFASLKDGELAADLDRRFPAGWNPLVQPTAHDTMEFPAAPAAPSPPRPTWIEESWGDLRQVDGPGRGDGGDPVRFPAVIIAAAIILFLLAFLALVALAANGS